MITVDEAWDLINRLNEEAHGLAWDLWIKADEAEEDNDILAEEASDAQREYFWDILDEEVSEEDMEAIWHYCNTDPEFRDQFEAFYGEID